MSSINILVPRLYNQGGVANYYKTLREHLGPEYEYIYRGNFSSDESRLAVPWRMFKDYALFRNKTRRGTKAIVINSSLGTGGFFRDGLYMIMSPRNVEKIVFFHGWDPEFEKKIDNSLFLRKWLENTFLKADHIIVLSSEFKAKLREWGYHGPISLETTLVDEQLVKDETLESTTENRVKLETPTLLYLGNISRAKGVWEVLDSLKHLNDYEQYQDIQLKIAGAGKELDALQQYTEDNQLNVEFLGYVRDEQKAQAFKNAHIYVFPSIHGEGMPNSILEAMAFGLPIITTRVGGLPDFFEDGKMGLFLDSREPEHIAEKIRYLLDRPELMQQMSKYNFEYAKEHFYASKVAKRLEAIIDQVVKG